MYGLGTSVRNALYDRGVFRAHDLGARTISIGNITAGGTGKTPLVALVAEILAARGETVCILTRGYGRKNAGERVLVSDGKRVLADAASGGDEPVELARKLLGKAVVVSDADRVSAAAWARVNFGVTVFVLDDGFQHRRAKRDLDIVCVDATDAFGGGEMLPAGKLREPLRGLARANAFVVTRSNLVASTDEIRSRLRTANAAAPVFTAASKVSSIMLLGDFLGANAGGNSEGFHTAESAYLFCAIGNPESLTAQLRKENFDIRGRRAFPDHHAYSQIEIAMVEASAEAAGARCLLTTGKDAVKLAGLQLRMPCYVFESTITLSDRDAFEKLVTSLWPTALVSRSGKNAPG